MAYLLPTITILKEKWSSKDHWQHHAKHCYNITCGNWKTFWRYFCIFEDSCSAVIHLKFKTSWTDNGAIIDSGIQHVQQLLSAATEVHSAELAAASQLRNDDIDADFFIQRRAPAATGVDIITQYLQTESDDATSFSVSLELKELFVKTQHAAASQCRCWMTFQMRWFNHDKPAHAHEWRTVRSLNIAENERGFVTQNTVWS